MQVVAVQIHGLIPRGYEVLHEDLLRVGRCINFRDGPELRVETEDQVHMRAILPSLNSRLRLLSR
jgi:hypothetical protein